MLRKKIYKVISGVIVCLFLGTSTAKAINLNEFISKTYEVFLNRGVDPNSEYWEYSITNHEKSLNEYMISILSSEEFLNRKVSDEDFINMVYTVLINRAPEESEKNYWLEEVKKKSESLKDNNKARIEIVKNMMGESFFKELAGELKVTEKFEKLNDYGVEELTKDYPEENKKYVDNFYEGFDDLGKDLYGKVYGNIDNRQKFLEYIEEVLPIYNNKEDKYEDLKKVSDDKIERIVYGLDYKIEFPYDKTKAVYISPYLQMNEGESLKFVTLGLSITSRGLGKKITDAKIILGDKAIDLTVKYNDESKYDSKGISVHEFEFKIATIEELKLLDEMLSSDLSKLKFTFDNSKTYLYSLYEKDRVRNTLRFMSNMYTQILLSYLFESKDVFDSVVASKMN